jgi:hypothetical protein
MESRGQTVWNFSLILRDPLLRVLKQQEEYGTFEIQLGKLPQVITIEVGRHMTTDRSKVWVSHTIQTPVQMTPYRSARPYWRDPEIALRDTVRAFTDYYRKAVRAGHQPDQGWLVQV